MPLAVGAGGHFSSSATSCPGKSIVALDTGEGSIDIYEFSPNAKNLPIYGATTRNA